MNISHKNIDDVNIQIQIELTPEDYNPKVDSSIKEQAKKANLPGFRPGKVPTSHIRRMYGKSILFEEVNKVVSDALSKYINEKELEVLGQPLPVESDKDKEFNWDFKDTFDFTYEIGVSPDFEIPFTEESEFTKYDISVDADSLSDRVKSLRQNYGKMSNPEVSEDGDILYVELKQDKEEGIETNASIRLDMVKDAKIKKSLIGLKKDDEITIDVKKAFAKEDLVSVLNINEKEAEELDETKFSGKVININRVEEAELNQEFFDKVFPNEKIENEDDFSKKVEEQLKEMLEQNSLQKFRNDLYTFGMKEVNITLPEEFLKRWLKATNPEIKEEELEQGFSEFLDNLKWTIIENKIMKENNIEVKYDDVMDLAKERIGQQMRMYGIQEDLSDEDLTQYAMQFLQDQEQGNRLFDEAKALKIFDFLNEKVKTKKKKITQKKFMALD